MRAWLAIGALNGFLAVVAGAIGAHALGGHLIGGLPNVFEKAANYHLVHALALTACALGLATGTLDRRLGVLACIAFQAGIVLFCGALYARGATGFYGIVFLAPFGGIALMLGWLLLAIAAWRGPTPR